MISIGIRIQGGNQAGCRREIIIDLVQVGQQVRLPGGHSPLRLQPAHPAFLNTRGVDQGLLDFSGGGGFLRRHGGGPHQDPIDRHGAAAVA